MISRERGLFSIKISQKYHTHESSELAPDAALPPFRAKNRCNGQNFARAATAARVTKRNAIERELWCGQFEVYSSFGYLGVFMGCRLSSRWSLIGCNGRNGCGNGPVFRGKVRRGVCFRSKFLATENAARGLLAPARLSLHISATFLSFFRTTTGMDFLNLS